MVVTYERVMTDLLKLLTQLSEDWEYSGTITPETGMLSELGLESLELVVLGVAIQEHYKAIAPSSIPFPEFLTDLGERNVSDVYVGEVVEFIYRHLNPTTARANT